MGAEQSSTKHTRRREYRSSKRGREEDSEEALERALDLLENNDFTHIAHTPWDRHNHHGSKAHRGARATPEVRPPHGPLNLRATSSSSPLMVVRNGDQWVEQAPHVALRGRNAQTQFRWRCIISHDRALHAGTNRETLMRWSGQPTRPALYGIRICILCLPHPPVWAGSNRMLHKPTPLFFSTVQCSSSSESEIDSRTSVAELLLGVVEEIEAIASQAADNNITEVKGSRAKGTSACFPRIRMLPDASGSMPTFWMFVPPCNHSCTKAA